MSLHKGSCLLQRGLFVKIKVQGLLLNFRLNQIVCKEKGLINDLTNVAHVAQWSNETHEHFVFI